MTLTTLIKKLQKLEAEGNGSLSVRTPEIDKYELIKKVHVFKIRKHYRKGLKSFERVKSIVSIE